MNLSTICRHHDENKSERELHLLLEAINNTLTELESKFSNVASETECINDII